MDIAFSDYAAGAALIVSLVSVYYTKSQRDIALATQQHDLMAHLTASHEHHRQLLREIEGLHRQTLDSLRTVAGDAYRFFLAQIDRFDSPDSSNASEGYSRPLRHVIGEASSMLFYAMNGQLAWQSGVNISHRFYRMSTLEDQLVENAGVDGQSERTQFREQYWRDPNRFQETELLGNPYFCGLVRTAKKRITATRGGDVLTLLLTTLEPVRAQLALTRAETRPSQQRLEDALKENLLEQFPLSASAQLLRAMKRTCALFDTLDNLIIFNANADDLHRYYNFVSIVIYGCAVIEALMMAGHWGWGEEL